MPPIGPYEDFDECVDAQRAKGNSKNSSERICGEMESENNKDDKPRRDRDMEEAFDECVDEQREKGESRIKARRICEEIMEERKASAALSSPKEPITQLTHEKGKFYVKAFLIDESLNRNDWAVTAESIPRNIKSFKGKPLVLTHNFDHPGTESDTLQHWLKFQETYRVGNIIDIQAKQTHTGSTAYYAIIEVTDPDVRASMQNNNIPHYVSPAIAQPISTAANTVSNQISDWTGIHLAIVDEPAYGVKKAVISEMCGGDRRGCLLQLMKANIERFGEGNCGFCRKEAMHRYRINVASIVSTSQARKTSPNLSKALSKLEQISSRSAESFDECVQALQNEGHSEEEARSMCTSKTAAAANNQTKQPVTIPAGNMPKNFHDLLAENQKLLGELELRELKIQELTEAHSTVQDRIAALELRDRRKDIERIVTPDIIKDDKARLEKIKYLTGSSIPISEIEAVYNDLKVTIKKASLNQRAYGGKVPYVTSNLSTNSNYNSNTLVDEDTGMTPLQKQMAVLKGGI